MRKTKLSVSLAAALLGAAIGVLPAGAQAGAQVRCGDRIGPGDEVVLDEDLACAGGAAALLVTGPAVLDLNGFQITCTAEDAGTARQVGILLLGWAVTVRNGSIDGCHNGIVAAGNGFHRLDGVATLFGSGDGIVLASDANHVREALALFHDGAGIAVRGGASVVTDSFAIGNQVGFGVGRRSMLRRNVARLNEHDGFAITGSSIVLVDNRAEDNLAHGVRVGPQASALSISGTGARRNGLVDLADETPGCGDNRWRDNLFETRNQPCVE